MASVSQESTRIVMEITSMENRLIQTLSKSDKKIIKKLDSLDTQLKNFSRQSHRYLQTINEFIKLLVGYDSLKNKLFVNSSYDKAFKKIIIENYSILQIFKSIFNLIKDRPNMKNQFDHLLLACFGTNNLEQITLSFEMQNKLLKFNIHNLIYLLQNQSFRSLESSQVAPSPHRVSAFKVVNVSQPGTSTSHADKRKFPTLQSASDEFKSRVKLDPTCHVDFLIFKMNLINKLLNNFRLSHDIDSLSNTLPKLISECFCILPLKENFYSIKDIAEVCARIRIARSCMERFKNESTYADFFDRSSDILGKLNDLILKTPTIKSSYANPATWKGKAPCLEQQKGSEIQL